MVNPAQNQAAALQQVLECYGLCVRCAAECLDQRGPELTDCIKLCHVCADICGVCAQCMANGLSQSRPVCAACAEICDACAAECDKGGGIMKECATACRNCATTCRQMAAQRNA